MVEESIFHFQVQDQAEGTRLDLLIPRLIPGLSRSRAQKIISTGQVTINGRPAPKRYLARSHDILRVTLPPPVAVSLRPENIPVRVLYQDDDLAAIDKPAGLVVHPAPGHPAGTLVNALLYLLPNLSEIGGEFRPGIIHRLDKDTSGLVLVALNDPTHRRLSLQFACRKLRKTYLGLAWGDFRETEGTWDLALGRDTRDRKKISPRTRRPKPAITRYRVIRRFREASLLEISPETGRTHQIRVHLAAAHHPLLGDPLYGPKPRRESSYLRANEAYGFSDRLALHAWKLCFFHPTDRDSLELIAPPPPEFERLLLP